MVGSDKGSQTKSPSMRSSATRLRSAGSSGSMNRFKLKIAVDKGEATDEQIKLYEDMVRGEMLVAKHLTPDEQLEVQVQEVYRRFKSKFDTEEEKVKYYNDKKEMEIRNRFEELNFTDMKANQIREYDAFMELHGI